MQGPTTRQQDTEIGGAEKDTEIRSERFSSYRSERLSGILGKRSGYQMLGRGEGEEGGRTAGWGWEGRGEREKWPLEWD